MRHVLAQTESDHPDHAGLWGWSARTLIRQGFDHLDHLDHPKKLSSAKRIRDMYVCLYVFKYLYRLARKRWSTRSETCKANTSMGSSRPGGMVKGGHSDHPRWSKSRVRPISAYFLGNLPKPTHRCSGVRTYYEARNIHTIT